MSLVGPVDDEGAAAGSAALLGGGLGLPARGGWSARRACVELCARRAIPNCRTAHLWSEPTQLTTTAAAASTLSSQCAAVPPRQPDADATADATPPAAAATPPAAAAAMPPAAPAAADASRRIRADTYSSSALSIWRPPCPRKYAGSFKCCACPRRTRLAPTS